MKKTTNQIAAPAWMWQGLWTNCKHKLEITPILDNVDLTFQCKKCKWYFHYVHRLEPYFQPDKKLDKKKQTRAKLK